MKDTNLELLSERGVQSGKEGPNHPELGAKLEAGLKNTIAKTGEKKRKAEKIKIINKDDKRVKDYKNKINKIGFSDCKNLSGTYLNYKGKKGNIKNCKTNKNKRKQNNNKKNADLIRIMIYFNLKISNNEMIKYKFSNITLKIQGPGD